MRLSLTSFRLQLLVLVLALLTGYNASTPSLTASPMSHQTAEKNAAEKRATRQAAARRLIDAAKSNAKLIPGAKEQMVACLAIASAQSAWGNLEEARKSVKEASAAAAKIAAENEKSKTPYKIALANAECGQITEAKAMAASINSDVGKAQLYSGIACAQAKHGDVAGARHTARLAKSLVERLPDDFYRRCAYLEIASAEAEAGDVAAAKATAKSLADTVSRGSAYGAIAKAQAKAGDMVGAKATAAMIDTESGQDAAFAKVIRDSLYMEMATIDAQRGNAAEANAIIGRMTTDDFKATSYIFVAIALVEAGDRPAALQSIQLAKASLVRSGSMMGSGFAYATLAEAQAKAEDLTGARDSLALAKSALEKIVGKYDRALACHQVVRSLVLIGELTEAKAIAAKLTDRKERDLTFFWIVAGLAEKGKIVEAIDLATTEISDPDVRCHVFAHAAKELNTHADY